MSEPREDPLLRIADAIARDVPVDWEREAEQSAESRAELDSLREVERIARAHVQVSGGGERTEEPSLVGTTLAHYRILERIGSGGMGVVYRARDDRLERDVAIKLLRSDRVGDEASRKALLQEARIACSIAHPNVAAVHDVGEAEGHIFFVMECVEGTTLYDGIRGRALPARTAVEYGIQIADALRAAHEAGVVHRDLKSLNVCITPAGLVKVLDFGLAIRTPRRPSGAADAPDPGVPGGIPAGTVSYMSPEAIRGDRVDARTDIWSLGVILFEALTGKRPFEAESSRQLERAILDREPGRLPASASQELRRVVERCLQKEPRRRYQGAGEVRAALEAVRDAPPSSHHGLSRAARRLTLAAAIAAAGALAAWIAAPRVAPWLARLGIAPSAPGHSMAVLPIRNELGSADQEFLADGLTDQLINRFAGLSSIRVLSRTSSEAMGRDRRPIPELARAHGLDLVLEGAIQRTGDHLRVNVRLVDAKEDRPVWAESYDRKVGELPTLDRTIALAVAQGMNLRLTASERAHLNTAHPVDLEAYRSYVRGRHYAAERNYRLALQCFRDATRRDSSFAAAHAGVADCYTEMLYYGQSPPGEALPRAGEAAARALEIDSTQAAAHLALAFLHGLGWNWPDADRELSRAIADEPGNAEVWYRHSMFLGVLGQRREHLEEMKRAAGLDPMSARLGNELGLAHLNARDLRGALARFREIAARDEGKESRRARSYGGRCLVLSGRAGEGVREIRAAAGAEPTMLEREELAYALARHGESAAARRVLADLSTVRGGDTPSPLAVAATRLALGEVASAWSTLERACAERDSRILWLQVDQRFDAIRGDARYAALLSKMGLREGGLARGGAVGAP